MKKIFSPDFYFGDVFSVTPDFLLSNGISLLILDIDNTLVTYAEARPTDRVYEWTDKIKAAGIKLSIASNNHGKRVDTFAETLGIFTVSDSNKPSTRSVKLICEHYSEKPSDTAVIGDQIFTDVVCANRAGAVAILVRPLPYNENLFFRFKRFFEKPIIKKFKREHPDKCFPKGENGK